MNSADAILQVMQERFDALDMELAEKSRDPLRVPASQIGHLAWSRGLDYWNSAWTLSEKRQIVNEVPERLRRRGTAQAVDDALEIYPDLTAVEWHEQVPEGDPGTGVVETVYGSGLIVDPYTQGEVYSLLARESRVSIHWELRLTTTGASAIGDEARGRFATLYYLSGEIDG